MIGFDNVPESALSEPPLTTIDQSVQQMGFDAVQLLIRLIDGAAVAEHAPHAADAARRPAVVPRSPGDPVTTAKIGAEPAYKDAQRPVDDRVDDLLARMTIDEQLAQLGSAWVFQLADGTGFSADESSELLRHGLGQVTRVSGASAFGASDAARVSNEIQRYLVEQTRLGIPAIVHEEICSGLMAREATVFPQAIGLASTWEPELAEALADTVRAQMRARGAHQGLSPVLDVCRDPRWGRLEETFGEDPHLVARMGVAFVRGLQGADLEDGVIATAKHLVGYGASEGGMNWAPAHLPPRELARRVPPSLSRRPSARRPALGDERLQRARRHPVRRRLDARSRSCCGGNGASTAASWPTTSPFASSPTTTASPPTPSMRPRWR